MNTVYVWEKNSITITGKKWWSGIIIHCPKWKLVKGEKKTRKGKEKKNKEAFKNTSW